jgi:hypothetical protein
VLVWGVRRLARSRLWTCVASAAYIAGAVSLSIIGLSSALAASG